MLAAVGEVADFHHALGQFVAPVDEGQLRARLRGRLELFAEGDLLHRVVHPVARRAQSGDVGKGRRPLRLAADHRIHLGRRTKGRHEPALVEQEPHRHVADGETHRRQRRTTQFFHQVVVAPAARDGAQLALAIKGLEHEARVVGQPAHHAEVHLHKLAQPHRGQTAEKLAPVRQPRVQGLATQRRKHGLERGKTLDAEKGENLRLRVLGERAKSLGVGLERVVADLLVFVHRAEHGLGPGLVEPERGEVVQPEGAIAEPHIKILRPQPEARQGLHEQADQLDLRLGPRLAENVAVELEKRALAPLLRAFVAVELPDAAPLDRTLQRVGLRPDQTADGGGHLGPQRDLAAALVREGEKLRLDLVARLALVEVERLQHGRVVFGKPIRMRRPAPLAKEVIPAREGVGIKFAKTRQGLELGHDVGNREKQREKRPACAFPRRARHPKKQSVAGALAGQGRITRQTMPRSRDKAYLILRLPHLRSPQKSGRR